MTFDFILRNARIAGRAETLLDIAVMQGLIAEIAPGIKSDAPSEDAGGRLVIAGLVDTHIHLDKSCILDRCRTDDGDLASAIAKVSEAKLGFTPEDVAARPTRTLEMAILNGRPARIAP